MKVADLTVEEFRVLLRDTLDEPVLNDEGELRPEFADATRASVATGKGRIGSDELRRRLAKQ